MLQPVLALLLGCSGAAAYGNDQLELASALAQRGWLELAEEVCDRLEKNPAAASARVYLPVVRAEILVERARREPDPWKAAKRLDGAASLLGAPASGEIGAGLGRDARSGLGDVLVRKARRLADAAESSDGDAAAALRQEALKAYEAAERFLRGFEAELARLAWSRDVEEARIVARLELPRAIVAQVKLARTPEPARGKRMREAIEQLASLELDCGGDRRWLQALLEEAQCWLEIPDVPRGEAKLLALLKEAREPGLAADFRAALANAATAALSRSFRQRGKALEGLAIVDLTLKEHRAAASPGAVLPLRLERAEALYALNKIAEALSEAQAVLIEDSDGPFGMRAQRCIATWAKEGPSAPEALLLVADFCMSKRQFRSALLHLRQCVEACGTEAQRAAFEPRTAFKRGECFHALDRRAEAAMAFEEVFRKFPSHELAPRAGFEAVRCLNGEFGRTGDRQVEERMEKLLDDVAREKHDERAEGLLRFLKAETLERKAAFGEAAELFRRAASTADVSEEAMVRAGYCFRRDALDRWEKGKRADSLKEDVAKDLRRAVDSLAEAIRLLERPREGAEPGVVRARERMLAVALRELASLYLHPLIGRAKEAVEILWRCEKLAAPDSDSLDRVWELEVRTHLLNDDPREASAVLEKMIEKYPEAASTLRACRALGSRLDRRAAEMMERKETGAAVADTLKKAARYTKRWVEISASTGAALSADELRDAADRLYRVARAANELDAKVLSFLDLEGRRVPDAPAFGDAAWALTLLGARGKEFRAEDRIGAGIALGRCLAFQAADEKGWEKAKGQYEQLVGEFKLIGPDGRIDPLVAAAHPLLVAAYVEEAGAYYELAKAGQKFQYANAIHAYGNLIQAVESGTASWWNAKWRTASILFERGDRGDLELARVLLDNLELNHPGFDGGKFGLQSKFSDLRTRVRGATGK